MSLDYLTIGRRIHRLRKRADITQQMLAEKIGTSTAYISQLERGTKGISGLLHFLQEVPPPNPRPLSTTQHLKQEDFCLWREATVLTVPTQEI